MKKPIRPEWLLRQADELAGRYAGAGRPRSADLRRAVSSAYYALFHATTLAVADWLLAGSSIEERHALVRRFNHGSIRRVYELVGKPRGAANTLWPIYTKLNANAEVVSLADGFVELHTARERADYDHAAELSRLEALQLVEVASLGVVGCAALPTSHPVDWSRLATCLAVAKGSDTRRRKRHPSVAKRLSPP